MEDMLISQLRGAGYHVDDEYTPRDLGKVLPVSIQCFKNSSLKYLATITNIPLVQLMGISNEQPDPALVYTEAVLDDVKTYASAVGPDKKLFTLEWGVNVSQAIKMRKWASDRNLFFVPWSFQEELKYIPEQFDGDADMEMKYYYGCLQSTAIFHEFPDQAKRITAQCADLKASTCLGLCPYSL
jgi:glycerophosphoryl diester phosphodiesterase